MNPLNFFFFIITVKIIIKFFFVFLSLQKYMKSID